MRGNNICLRLRIVVDVLQFLFLSMVVYVVGWNNGKHARAQDSPPNPSARTHLHSYSSSLTHFFVRVCKDGQTPLHMAADNGHVTVVDLLLKNGADKEAKTNVSEDWKC